MLHGFRKALILIISTAVIVGVGIFAAKYEVTDSEKALANTILSDGSGIKPWYCESEDIWYYFLPSYADMTAVSLATEKGTVSIDGIDHSDGDSLDSLYLDTKYTLFDSFDKKTQNIKFVKSGNVATVFVQTATGSMKEIHKAKEHKEIAKITIVDKDGNIDTVRTDSRFKGHGNSTWNLKKKPYTMIFNEKESVLGMNASYRWILLANCFDHSNLRNKIVNDIAKEVGFDETADCEYADLYLNGEYNGVYMITQTPDSFYERSSVNEENVYLFTSELHDRVDETNYPIYIQDGETIVDVILPKVLHGEEKAVADSIVTEIDELISSEDSKLGDWIDIDSWAKKYLIDEIFENYDAGQASSYFYTSVGTGDNKVYAGPIWDYDNTLGNRNGLYGTTINPEILYAKNKYMREDRRTLWYASLYDNPVFYNRMVQLFQEQLMPAVEDVINSKIYNIQKEIAAANRVNDIRWEWDSSDEVEHITEYLGKRLEFLKGLWIDGKEYCIVRGNRSRVKRMYYIWYYLEKGKAISDSEYCDELMSGITWYREETGEVFDLDTPVTEDIFLVDEKPVPDSTIGKIKNTMKEEKKLFAIIASIIAMGFCLVILAFSNSFRRGVK